MNEAIKKKKKKSKIVHVLCNCQVDQPQENTEIYSVDFSNSKCT